MKRKKIESEMNHCWVWLDGKITHITSHDTWQELSRIIIPY